MHVFDLINGKKQNCSNSKDDIPLTSGLYDIKLVSLLPILLKRWSTVRLVDNNNILPNNESDSTRIPV